MEEYSNQQAESYQNTPRWSQGIVVKVRQSWKNIDAAWQLANKQA
jgi:hypothetical protein